MISKEEWEKLKQKERLLKQAAKILRTEEKHVIKTVRRFLKDLES